MRKSMVMIGGITYRYAAMLRFNGPRSPPALKNFLVRYGHSAFGYTLYR